jgi:FMN reductase
MDDEKDAAPMRGCEAEVSMNGEDVCSKHPHVVLIGGTTVTTSTTQRLLSVLISELERAGATTELFCGPDLVRLPLYAPEHAQRTAEQQALISGVRRCDGLILATPAYHGGMSGLVKNAVDLLEDLRTDARPYLDGRAVGCIVTGSGWQGCGTTLTSVRTIVHALRGWPTPLGVIVNTSSKVFDDRGNLTDDKLGSQLQLLAHQVMDFACAFAQLRGAAMRRAS